MKRLVIVLVAAVMPIAAAAAKPPTVNRVVADQYTEQLNRRELEQLKSHAEAPPPAEDLNRRQLEGGQSGGGMPPPGSPYPLYPAR